MTEIDLSKGLAEGDNISIRVGEQVKAFKILARDHIYLLRTAYAAIASAGSLAFTEETVLNPPDDEVYQVYELELVRGNVKVQFKQPSATDRLGTERSPQGGLMSDRNDHGSLNFWIIEDFPPSIQITNDTNVSITPVLRYWGWRYLIRPLAEKPVSFRMVSIGGISR